MAGRPVDEEILKMSLDNATFMKNLDATIASMTKFKASVEKSVDVNAGGFSKFTSTIGNGIKGLLSNIPILNNFKKSAGDSVNVNPSIFTRFTSGVTAGVNSLLGKVPILNNFKKGAENAVNVSAKPMDEFASQIGADANKVNSSIGVMGNGTAAVAAKFSALQSVALGALMSIGAAAVQKGAEIAKSLSVDPIMEGFQQYSDKMSAVIMLQGALGKGANDSINKNLQDLDHYAMVTKYSVADMQTNLSQFVNNGVQIDTASTAIKGFGNLAASAGASTQGFSAALQFGVQQALAMGKMTTQNWMSIENAGMATQKFKDALTNQAKEMGKNVDMSNGFRESLQEGWLTNDVFIATLNKMANDKSMLKMAQDFHSFGEVSDAVSEGVVASWSNVFEELIGGAEESTKIWTNVGNVLIDSTQAFPNMILSIAKSFDKLGGRKAMIDTVVNAWNSFQKIIAEVKTQIGNVFPPGTINIAEKLANAFKALSGAVKISQSSLNTLGTIFRGFFSLIDMVAHTVIYLGKDFMNLIPKTAGLGIMDLVKKFADWLTTADITMRKGHGLAVILGDIQRASMIAGEAIQKFADKTAGVRDVVGKLVSILGSGIIGAFKLLGSALNAISGDASSFAGGAGKILVSIFQTIGTALTTMFKSFDGVDFSNLAVLAIIAGLAKKLSGIGDSFSNLGEGIKSAGKNIAGVLDVFKELPDALSAMTENVKSQSLRNIAISLGILAASILVLSTVKVDKLVTSLTALTVGLRVMVSGMGSMVDIMNPGSVGKVLAGSAAMQIMAGAMLTLSLAIKVLSTMSIGDLAKGLVGVAAGMTIMVVALKAMSKIGPQVIVGAAAMNLMATAISVMTIPIAILGKMKLSTLAQGLGGVAAGMTVMVAGMAILSKVASGPQVVAGAIAMNLMATSMVTLSGALKIMGSMSMESIGKSMLVLAGGMTVMVVAMKLMSSNVGGAVAMTVLAAGLTVFAGAMKLMGSMSMESIGKSMIVLAGGLTVMSVAMRLMGSNIAGAAGIAIMAAGMVPLASAMKVMSSIPLVAIAAGLVGFTGAIVIMVSAATLLEGAAVGVLAFNAAAVGMLVTATAVNVMAGALKVMSSIPLADLGVALLGLAGGMAIMVVAGIAMSGAAVGFLAFGAAMALIGGGVALVGIGINDLAGAFLTLSKINLSDTVKNMKGMITGLAQIVPAAINMVLAAVNQIVVGVTKMVPNIVKAIAAMIDGLTALVPNIVQFVSAVLTGLQTLIPQMLTVGMQAVGGFLQAIIVMVPQITATGQVVVMNFVNAITQMVPFLAQAGLTILTSFLNVFAANIGTIVQAGTNIIVNFLNGIAAAVPQIAQAGTNIIIAFITSIGAQSLQIVTVAMQTLITFINGLADAVDTYGPQINAAVFKLMNAIVNNIINFISGGTLNLQGQNTIQNFIGGAVQTGATIWSNIVNFFTSIPGNIAKALSSLGQMAVNAFNSFKNSASQTASGIWGAITSFFTSIPGNVGRAISGLAGQASSAFNSFKNSAAQAAGGIWGSISGFFTSIPGNISKAIGDLGSIGSNIVDGIIEGVTGAAGRLASSVKNMASNAIDTVKKTLGIHSPSRAFRDQVGKFIPMGIAAGIDKYSYHLDNATSTMADAAVKATQSLVSRIGDDMNLQPTISPIMDLSNVRDVNLNGTIAATSQNGRNMVAAGALAGGGVAVTGDINIPINVPEGTSQQQVDAIDSHLRTAVKTIISDELRKGL